MSRFRASVPLTQEWEHFRFAVSDGVARVTLNRPGKLNALTFEAYADLRDLLAPLPHRGGAPARRRRRGRARAGGGGGRGGGGGGVGAEGGGAVGGRGGQGGRPQGEG